MDNAHTGDPAHGGGYGGVAFGSEPFGVETGIKPSDWRGKVAY